MSSKKDMSLKKGMRVYIRKTWGDDLGTIDTSQLYTIRSIGLKQVVLDYPNESTQSPIRRRPTGRAFFLYPKEEAENLNSRGGRGLYPWHWSQLLVPLGKEGWDPEINIL